MSTMTISRPQRRIRGARRAITLCAMLACGLLGACGGGEDDAVNDAAMVATDQPLDLALAGSGHFVALATDDGSLRLTRNGHFQLDADGRLVDADGQPLAAWTAQADGATSTASTASAVQALPAVQRHLVAAATTRLTMTVHLDAREAVTDPALAFDPADDRSWSTATRTTVYDLSGAAHTLTLHAIHLAANEWQLIPVLDGVRLPVTPLALSFGMDGAALGDAGVFTRDLTLDAHGLNTGLGTVTFDLSAATQRASAFALLDLAHDGESVGDLSEIAVDAQGQVTVRYDSGLVKALGRLVVGRLGTGDAITRSGSSSWRCTAGCPGLFLGPAGEAPLPEIRSRALNMNG